MSKKIEQGILACILKDGESIVDVVSEGIKPKSFEDPQCSKLFEDMLKVYSNGENPDYVEMCMQENADISLLGYLDELVDTSAMLGSYLKKKKASMAKYELLRKLKEIWELVKNDTCDSEKAIGLMCELNKNSKNEKNITVKKEVEKLKKIAITPEDERSELTRTFTFGLKGADLKLSRIRKSELVVVGARPSTGKTSLACQIMDSNAKEQNNILFFSFETDADELSEIIMLQRTKQNLDCITQDGTDWWDRQTDDSLDNMQIISKPCTVEEIVGKVKANHGAGKCDMVIIDYLQLIVPSDNKQSREQQVAHISRQLRLLTIELCVPVIALAQLNRGTEKEDRPPRMSDLRESGAIEQDASRIIMIHRPKEKFDGSTQDPEQGYTSFVFDTALLQVKCKKGPKGVGIPTRFMAPEQKFYEISSISV
jgi:replicative DNA helicase